MVNSVKMDATVMVVILLVHLGHCNAECKVDSQFGGCNGPMERSYVIRNHLDRTNSGCPINKVAYKKDQDPKTLFCGECTPGLGGWEDPDQSCHLDEYCTDDGICSPLKSSPFYGQECPYETGSSPSWCGAGLRCYHHKCLPCISGMIDYSDGKICIYNSWTYSKWKALLYNPDHIILLLILILLLSLFITTLGYKLWVTYGRMYFYEFLKRRQMAAKQYHIEQTEQEMHHLDNDPKRIFEEPPPPLPNGILPRTIILSH